VARLKDVLIAGQQVAVVQETQTLYQIFHHLVVALAWNGQLFGPLVGASDGSFGLFGLGLDNMIKTEAVREMLVFINFKSFCILVYFLFFSSSLTLSSCLSHIFCIFNILKPLHCCLMLQMCVQPSGHRPLLQRLPRIGR